MAVNVRFDEEIKVSTLININAIATILKLAKHMTNLKAFIHVSTIYANCHVNHIEERLYYYPINYRTLITITNSLPESVIKKNISRYVICNIIKLLNKYEVCSESKVTTNITNQKM
ncbi:fatty acyl-CoA reductase wat-like [Solenopsis invicta]|uniref:fatty acyl-CoA reductase wat-like n=1 Tax=Solenopsis invicta TaxID=13686 RepID=UPI00193D5178|nr:fatty acyl-CoA reductase wat-like [Solenopsis invicta]